MVPSLGTVDKNSFDKNQSLALFVVCYDQVQRGPKNVQKNATLNLCAEFNICLGTPRLQTCFDFF